MASFNQVTLMGNITRDIELRYVGDNTVCDIGLAVNERRKKGSEWVDETMFIDVTCWGRTAEIAHQYLRKGSPVLVSGRLKLDQWEQDGNKRTKHKVTCDRLQLIGGKDDGQPQQRTQQAAQTTTGGSSFGDDEAPF